MSIWHPLNSISVKALALIWQDDALLLAEVKDDQGRVTGMRPLGGTVEFGERWQDALQREILEELGARITLLDQYFVIENLFEHRNQPGHEVVFLCNAHFTETRFYQSDKLVILEDGEPTGTASWVTLEELNARHLELYPSGLMDQLSAHLVPQSMSRSRLS